MSDRYTDKIRASLIHAGLMEEFFHKKLWTPAVGAIDEHLLLLETQKATLLEIKAEIIRRYLKEDHDPAHTGRLF